MSIGEPGNGDGIEYPENSDDIVALEINGVLDLHPFAPKDVKHLVPDYLEECFSRKIYSVKIIHGKGIGNLRRTVHAVLDRSSLVLSYNLADPGNGSWGATLVQLRKKI